MGPTVLELPPAATLPSLQGLDLAPQIGGPCFRGLPQGPFRGGDPVGFGAFELGSGKLDPQGVALGLQYLPVEAFPFGRGLFAF